MLSVLTRIFDNPTVTFATKNYRINCNGLILRVISLKVSDVKTVGLLNCSRIIELSIFPRFSVVKEGLPKESEVLHLMEHHCIYNIKIFIKVFYIQGELIKSINFKIE